MHARRAVAFRLLVHVALLLPLALLLLDLLGHRLSANPIEEATWRTGKTTLVLLILSLACTPAHHVVRLRALLQLRRTLGLYAFAYACIHAMIFVGVDYRFDPDLLGEAIFEKRYALAGLAAFLLLALPAATSFGTWSKRLGPLKKFAYRAVYPAVLVAVVHFIWQTKGDKTEPLAYAAIVLLLLLLRTSVSVVMLERLRLYLARLILRRVRPEHGDRPSRHGEPGVRERVDAE